MARNLVTAHNKRTIVFTSLFTFIYTYCIYINKDAKNPTLYVNDSTPSIVNYLLPNEEHAPGFFGRIPADALNSFMTPYWKAKIYQEANREIFSGGKFKRKSQHKKNKRKFRTRKTNRK